MGAVHNLIVKRSIWNRGGLRLGLWLIAAWRLLHPSCFTELQVAARESPKRFMKKVLSMPLEIRRSSTMEALSDPSIELDVPEFLLQCLKEISTMESPEKLPGLIVGQYSLLLKDANPLDWNESSRDHFCSKILDVAIKLWKLPTAKGSALRLLDLWQVRSKHITTDAWSVFLHFSIIFPTFFFEIMFHVLSLWQTCHAAWLMFGS